MSCQTEGRGRRRWALPWYVVCAILAVATAVVQIVLGRPWVTLLWPLVALSVAACGWLYSPRRLTSDRSRNLHR